MKKKYKVKSCPKCKGYIATDKKLCPVCKVKLQDVDIE